MPSKHARGMTHRTRNPRPATAVVVIEPDVDLWVEAMMRRDLDREMSEHLARLFEAWAATPEPPAPSPFVKAGKADQ